MTLLASLGCPWLTPWRWAWGCPSTLADVLFTLTLPLWLAYSLGWSFTWPPTWPRLSPKLISVCCCSPDPGRPLAPPTPLPGCSPSTATVFLLVHVSLVHKRAARTMVPGLLFIFALCLEPYYLLLAPWVAWQEGVMALDVLHTFSLDPLISCFSVPSFPQASWMLSCHRELGERGD